MMRTATFLALATFLLAPALLHAQKIWSLKECIDHALKNNLQVKQNELNTELSRNRLEQSVAATLPSVNGNASHTYNYGRTIDPFTNVFVDQRVQNNGFSLSSSMTLFDGFQLQNTIRQSYHDYKASQYDVTKMKNDIALSVVNAYLQILFSKELVSTSRNQLEISVNQVDRTRKLVESGSLARGSLLDAEALAATEELKLINAQNQLDLSYLNLAQLLDLPAVRGFEIEDPKLSMPVENLIDNNPENIFNIAVQNQPEIKSAEERVKSAEKSLDVARGGLSPRLFLSGSLGTGYSDIRTRRIGQSTVIIPIGFTGGGDTVFAPQSIPQFEKTPFRDQLDDNYNKSISLSLNIPLFNGLQTRSSIVRARINKSTAELNSQLARNQLSKTIQQSYADANASLKKYTATVKSLESLKEAFKYTEQKFNVGLVNSVDYLNAKTNLNKAESDLLQAKYEFILKTKVLDFYLGKPLTF
jgi:outer membrane protein